MSHAAGLPLPTPSRGPDTNGRMHHLSPVMPTVGRVIAESEEDADTDVRPYMTKRKTGLTEGNVKTKSQTQGCHRDSHWGIA
jgi:hypothetical protein